MVFLALGLPLALLVVGMFVGGVGEAFFDVLWKTTMQTQTPSAERSRISSFEEGASLASVPLGFALGGWLESAVGPTVALLGGSVVLCIASVVVLALPSVRGVHAVHPPTASGLTNAAPIGSRSVLLGLTQAGGHTR